MTSTREFSVRWSAEVPPAPQETCTVSVPVHLRQEYPIGTQSLGHLLRDNFHPLVTIPLQFGLSAAHFSWAAWPRTRGNRHGKLSHVQEKYTSWISMHRTYLWPQLVAACRDGELGGATPQRSPARHAVPPPAAAHPPCRAAWDGSKPPRKARFVRIESALASGAGTAWTSDGTRSHVCGRAHFREQRDLAYRLNGVAVLPVAAQERTLVTFLWKSTRDKRRMLLERGLIDAVRARFPQVDVEIHDGLSEGTDAQLAWLSRTSVFVTNIGSAGFRLVYLPDGAQVRAAPGSVAPCAASDMRPLRLPSRPLLQLAAHKTPARCA